MVTFYFIIGYCTILLISDLFERFVALKERNTSLKVLLSVIVGSQFSKITADGTKRNKFITSANELLKKYGFDGMDLDWEKPYPADRVNKLIFKAMKQLKAVAGITLVHVFSQQLIVALN